MSEELECCNMFDWENFRSTIQEMNNQLTKNFEIQNKLRKYKNGLTNQNNALKSDNERINRLQTKNEISHQQRRNSIIQKHNNTMESIMELNSTLKIDNQKLRAQLENVKHQLKVSQNKYICLKETYQERMDEYALSQDKTANQVNLHFFA